MNVDNSEQVICCDIDETLIAHGKVKKGQKAVLVTHPYTKEQKLMRVHVPNLTILRDRLHRGATVIVWSAGGNAWAASVLRALNVKHPRIYVFSKPIAYIDDKTANEFMGEHIYLPIDSTYGS